MSNFDKQDLRVVSPLTHIEQVGMRFSWVIVFFSFFRCWWAISTDKIGGQPPPWVLFLWKSGKTTVNRCNRTEKHRLFAKSQHFRGRILLSTGPHTQEEDYRFAEVSVLRLFLVVFSETRRSHRVMAIFSAQWVFRFFAILKAKGRSWPLLRPSAWIFFSVSHWAR